ncbi:MAG: GNAT family N-acetyltransferase [Bdellovibrionota bacterium]
MKNINRWNLDYNKYIGHYSQYQKPANSNKVSTNFIRFIESDIGRALEYQRIAIHHIVLPPNCRTSLPHAESLEEEFIFVLQGQPHLWLNGYLYELKKDMAVGFPAGTGDAHTFINNTKEDIELLVCGDKTKKENRCIFPINIEQKETCSIWWEEAPKLDLGPHNGQPGPYLKQDLGTIYHTNIVFCPDLREKNTYCYPGDSETFGDGVRLTNRLGLKSLGIWYESLAPGCRSSFPHAHTHEEEFVFVLKGNLTVWLNGYAKEITKGEFVGFPSNTGLSHTLINNSNEPVVYICVGETAEFLDEKINYPLNPLRNKECERNGWLWVDAPLHEIGPCSEKPFQPLKNHLSLELAAKEDFKKILEIYLESPQYFKNVNGSLPTEKTVEQDLVDSPRNITKDYFKEFLLIKEDNQYIGVVDLHAHHSNQGKCYLGLLLIKENLFGKGVGKRCYLLIEDYINRALKCKKIKIGISDENNVTGFWRKMGFSSNGKIYEWNGENKTSKVQEFEKILMRDV